LAAITEKLETDQAQIKDLQSLAFDVNTHEDGSLFRDFLSRWRKNTLSLSQDPSDTDIIFDRLLAAGAHNALLEMACDRKKYSVFLSESHILSLMASFQRDCLGNREDEVKHLECLDNLYKCFALLLYSNVPPSAKSYSYLITSGVYGGTTEGLRRSVVSAKELLSIGLQLDTEALHALAVGYIRAQDFQNALSCLPMDVIQAAEKKQFSSSLPSPLVLGLAIRVLTSTNQLHKSCNLLELLIEHKATLSSNIPFGAEFWPSFEETVEKLVNAVENSKDEELISRLNKAFMC
jgi:hypothetical protein